MALERLTAGSPSAASQLPFYAPEQGQDRRASLADIAAIVAEIMGIETPAPMTTQYAAPGATGFTVAIAPLVDGGSVYLLLTPAAGYAAGTIELPDPATCADRQEVLVHCTQGVTTLTVDGNGATVNGAPVTIAASGFFRLRFDGVFGAWYRVG